MIALRSDKVKASQSKLRNSIKGYDNSKKQITTTTTTTTVVPPITTNAIPPTTTTTEKKKERVSTREPQSFPKIQISMNDNDDGQSTRNVRIGTEKRKRTVDNNRSNPPVNNDREKRQRTETYPTTTTAAADVSNVHMDRNRRQRDADYPVRGTRRQDDNAAAIAAEAKLRRELNIAPNRPLADSYVPSRDNGIIHLLT